MIPSERTPRRERVISPHPSLKPQSFMRQVVRAALPLGSGVVADTFMGGGATPAAAEALGVDSVGVERVESFFLQSAGAVPRLAALRVRTPSAQPALEF